MANQQEWVSRMSRGTQHDGLWDKFVSALGQLAPFGRSRIERVVVRYPETLFGQVEIVDTKSRGRRPIRILKVDGSWQSATFLDDAWSELVFPYHLLYNTALARVHPTSILMLGGGGYSYPKYLLCHLDDVRVDVVEADPLIIDIARRHFYLDRVEQLAQQGNGASRLRSLVCDARDFLELGAPDDPDVRYDLILNDCFAAERPVASLMTIEASRLIHRHLAQGGAYLVNVIGALEGRESALIRNLCRTLEQVFTHVLVLPCGRRNPSARDNNVIVASDEAWEHLQTFDLAPSELNGTSPRGKILTDADTSVDTGTFS